MDEISDRDRRILIAHKVFEAEKAIFVAQREVQAAQEKVVRVKTTYQIDVARVVGCDVKDLQFSDSMVCFGTKLIAHCVWDLRSPNTRWPFCVFCGSPRDGE